MRYLGTLIVSFPMDAEDAEEAAGLLIEAADGAEWPTGACVEVVIEELGSDAEAA